MIRLLRAVAGVVVLLLAGGAVAMPTATVAVEHTTIVFTGEIDERSAEEFSTALADHPELTLLRVNSNGGDVASGIRMGHAIHRAGLDVEVDGNCFSSCANYLFPAGRHKRITTGVVGWHGSAIQTSFGRHNLWGLTEPRWLRDLRALQAVLYAELGVDAEITVLGQNAHCHCQWFLDVPDMARFGIHDVEAAPDYAHARVALDDGSLIVRLYWDPARGRWVR